MSLFVTAREGAHSLLRIAAVASLLLLTACSNSGTDSSAAAPAGAPLATGAFDLKTNLGTRVTFSKNGVPGSAPPFQMTVGYGSAAFHNPKDSDDIVYTMSDRGPNIKCEDSADAPVEIPDFCGSQDGSGNFVVDNDGKIFPAPFFDPSIFKIQLKSDGTQITPTVLQVIGLKDRDGDPIAGLSNDLPDRPKDLTAVAPGDAVVSNTEKGYAADGSRLPFNQNSLDTEGLAQLPDGSFWVGEEYAPSVVHVAADGTVLERVVPADSTVINPISGQSMSVCTALKNGTIATPAADYPINCALPGILDLRSLNRGIEDVAVSPDGRTLYFGMQSPLSNPSKSAYKKSRNVRIFTATLNADGSFGAVTGEYVFVLDTPDTFAQDPGADQNDVKLSEMSVSPNGHLIQLERVSKTTKLYRVDFSGATNILGSVWDDRATQPSLTQQTDLAAAGIVPVSRTLVFDTATDAPDTISKIEGVAFLNDQYLLLVNDNDFGIEGDPSVFNVLEMAGAAGFQRFLSASSPR